MIRIDNAEAIDWLNGLSVNGPTVVLCDPPYGISTKSDGKGKLNPWADLMNSALFYREWLSLCFDLTGADGAVWSFLNWRSLPTFMKASADLSRPVDSLLVWDKEWIGPGPKKSLRPSYEMVALWAGSSFVIPDRSTPDIFRCKWHPAARTTGHPAQKPEDLCARILSASGVGPGWTVVDPFCGSGTTGVAAKALGADFLGCEIDPEWADRARDRVA